MCGTTRPTTVASPRIRGGDPQDTGLRRCGSSVLFFLLFRDNLLRAGVPSERLIGLVLDPLPNAGYLNRLEPDNHSREQNADSGQAV